MPEAYLQAAFEIKASCDEISRRILRWHWDAKPGPHSFDSLLEHIARRQEESPTYYGHMPDVSRKTSWQQLDTTLCMRVLLDPESDAAQPLDLLGSTAHPGAARRACNAVRTARNEAAHASDRAAGGQAAILFDEAVECIEDAYAGTAFSEKELAKYYQLSRDYLRRCGVGGREPAPPPNQPPAPEDPAPEVWVYPTGEARQKAAAARQKGSRSAAGTPPRESAAPARSRAARKAAPAREPARRSRTSREEEPGSRAAVVLALAALVIGLAVRAARMGVLPFL
ncbi:hypothetical protein B5G12_00950 [Faecalibacterium sp. An58]|uniref:hypothetical protein n=1 Tax=Faecalibacterium sp. An58 TaxID=1965648 RepID=UPI000B38DEE8|nr:hypothetical protein [Faecalibacterium sp. An58]OUN75668.1 hypothetical protein B5G12_00950 [Faecalibacterium sp. An58]